MGYGSGVGNIPELPPKKDVARALLLRGSVFVHLDPRSEGVCVPEYFRRQPQLVLQVGLDLAVPIPDLRVDDRGVSGTLSFNRSPFYCIVPWDAVFAMTGDDGKGMVWPESLPDEIHAEVERETGRRSPAFEGSPEGRSSRGRSSADAAEPLAAASNPELADDSADVEDAFPPLREVPSPSLDSAPKVRPSAQRPQGKRGDASKRGAFRLVEGEGTEVRPTKVASSRTELPPYLRVIK